MFDKYFKCCGWDVRLKSGEYVAYYNDVTGAELKNIIRNGYTADTYGKFVPNKAVAIFAEAIDTDEYKELQVLDFIDRLRLALNIIPKGYNYQIASYVKSNLGIMLIDLTMFQNILVLHWILSFPKILT